MNACRVQKTLHHHIMAWKSHPVDVTPGSVEKMEAHARSVTLASINIFWGLFALIARQIQYLQLEVSQTPSVNVTPGTRGRMEAHARCVVSTNSKQAWGLPTALIVYQTTQTPPAGATPGTRGRTEAHARSVVVAATKRDWGLVLA